MSMLAELVDLVIGVDTHADTHTAVLVAVDTRAVLDTITVAANPDGYTRLVALAESHGETRGGLRGWAVEGTGGYGPAWPGTWVSAGSWSSSSTARSARRGGTGPSPM
jgi:transposase